MRTLLLAVLITSGCVEPTTDRPATPAVPVADTMEATVADPQAGPDALFGRVWVRADSSAARGSLRVFLPDETTLTTSCTEVYRIDRWRADGVGRLIVTEDTQDIPVAYALDGDRLTLRLALAAGETDVQTYRPAEAPSVCPDLR